MIKELTEFYTPERILHRDEQIEKIETIFINFKKYNVASNVLIQGYSGGGKTTVINKITSGQVNNYVYVSGSQHRTSFRLLRAIVDLNYNTEERILTEGIKKFRDNPKIIIIDEINKVRDLRDLFDNLNTFYRETACPIILITNRRGLIEQMPDDARLTLFFERIEFNPYTPKELADIILDRIKIIKAKDISVPKIPEGSLNFICALGRKEGSARIALLITLKCILKNDFSQEYMRSIMEDIEKENWKKWIAELIETEKMFLEGLIDLSDKNKKISFSGLYAYMKKYTPQRISQLINSFEDYGIIKSEVFNLGRGGGRSRSVSFISEDVRNKLEGLIEV